MKKNILITALASATLLSSAAFAAYPIISEPVAQPAETSGFYVSGQMGWGDQYLKNDSELIEDDAFLFRSHASTQGGVAGRIAAGYNINPYLGLEVGGAKWTGGDYRVEVSSLTSVPLIGDTDHRVDTDVFTVDALATVSYPFSNGFRVFAKGGVAYERYSAENPILGFSTYYSGSGSIIANSVTFSHDSEHTSAWRPEAVAGIGYDFNEHWSTELAYSRVFGRGDNVMSSQFVPSLDMTTVGITYNI